MTTKPYKFRAFRCFDTLDILASSKEPRYRWVFDRSELAYLWGELSVFNKRFDEGEWKASYEFRIFDQAGRPYASMKGEADVARDLNVVYLRHGWGSETKGTWRKGRYRWEAWLNGEKLGEAWVAVLEDGPVDERRNPYLEPVSLGLFEAPPGEAPAAARRYLSGFDATATRYVHCRLVARNKKRDESWPCEVFFNFFFDTGELSCRSEVVREVQPGDELIEIEVWWGNERPGVAWFPDRYRVEVVFMNHLLGSFPFTVGEGAVAATAAETTAPFAVPAAGRPTPVPDQPESLDDALKDLDELVGLEKVKTRIREFAHYQWFLQLRRQRGLQQGIRPNLHAAFVGNPGTGKTTVARLLGQVYRKLGLLSRGHLVEVARSQLVAEYIGKTAPQVQEVIAKARGGVLFIDEAYALFRGAEDSVRDYGKEVIEVLVREMSDGPGDLAIVFAGYPAEMQIFFDGNPGLRSRLGQILEFDDYLPRELRAIAEVVAAKAEVAFAPAARELLGKRLVDLYRRRDRTFGNARVVADLVGNAMINLGVRLRGHPDPAALGRAELSTLQLEDVQKVFAVRRRSAADIPLDEELLADSLAELEGLVGLAAIKVEVGELVRLARFYREAHREEELAGLASHAVLTGNPGTGKTTVARLLGRIYRALGLLERGHLVECDRSGLVAGYLGQTALKTARLVDEAMGGVLFIDEAYALARDRHADGGFGAEAIEVLVKRMEDDRGEFILMAAGYTELMEEFLDANPGLRSRVGRVFHFPDYGADELFEIGLGLLARRGLTPAPDARDRLRARCAALGAVRGPGFGNARDVRRLVDGVVRRQHLRLAAMPRDARTAEAVAEVVAADVEAVAAGAAPPAADRPPGGPYL
jgi:SpoVK/Ycf46/Vps4 family AAA+-type ATPase